MAVAVAGALGAGLLPEPVLPYLGLSPLALGLRAAWRLWRERHDQDHDAMTERVGPGALSVAAVTFANGGDNIGVYVPAFTQSSPGGLATYLIVFLVLAAVWTGRYQEMGYPWHLG
jgi:cadmium resistance protein CadD (predicted permease)